MTFPRHLAPVALAAFAAFVASAAAQAQQTYKIAYVDPLSGPFANVGELMLTHIQYAVEDINAKGGVLGGTRLQLLQFDSKLSAQESRARWCGPELLISLTIGWASKSGCRRSRAFSRPGESGGPS